MMIILIIAALYVGMIGCLCYGWFATSGRAASMSVRQGVSIIIAMRNEEKNIGHLLTCLMRQKFSGSMEVIVVDDDSTDSSITVAKAFEPMFPCSLHIIRSSGSGKKAAISTGVSYAKHPLILTTDADCQMGKNWVQCMYEALQLPGTKLVTGLVKIEPTHNWLSRFQAIELAALMGSTAAFAQWKMPNMGNGANLGYWREVFELTGGYQSSQAIASGDDEFLIQQVHNRFPGGIRFVKATDAMVTTAPQPNWEALFMQRRRWAAKWQKGRPIRVWGVALCVGLYHLFWAALPLWAILYHHLQAEIILAFSLKLAAEYVFLNAVLRVVQQKKLVPYIFPLQLVYSCYVVWVGLHAIRGGYTWKERMFTR